METIHPITLKEVQLSNQETYAYRESGTSEKTLLLLHGNFTTSIFFETFINQVSNSFRTIAPDFRGYGHSTYNNPITSLEDLCEDLKVFLEALDISKVNLLGWSAGGPVAQLFACKYPSLVESLILVGSVGPRGTMILDANGRLMKKKEDFEKCWRIADTIGMIKAKNNKMLKWFMTNNGFRNKDLPKEEILDQYVDELKLQRNIVDILCALNNFNISSETNGICIGTKLIDRIQGPCLIVHGSHDENVRCVDSWEIKKYLLKKAKIEIIEGGRHFLFEPTNAEKISKLVKEFLGNDGFKKPARKERSLL